MSTPFLQIELQLVNGSNQCFKIYDAQNAYLLLEELHPAKAFSKPALSISEPHCLTTYKTQSIIRIDLIGEDLPQWPYMANASSMREVTRDEFINASQSEELSVQRQQAWDNPGRTQEGFTEVELTNGETIVWQLRLISTEMVSADITAFTHHMFDASSVHGKRLDNATTIVNMAHVVRFSFYPGPPSNLGRNPVVTRC
jgi:hypothetical protein